MKWNIPTYYVHRLNELSVQFFEYINNEDNYVTNNNKTQKTQIGQHKESRKRVSVIYFSTAMGSFTKYVNCFCSYTSKQTTHGTTLHKYKTIRQNVMVRLIIKGLYSWST